MLIDNNMRPPVMVDRIESSRCVAGRKSLLNLFGQMVKGVCDNSKGNAVH